MERPKPVFGFDFGFGSHIIAFTANLRGRGAVEVKDGTVCSAGNVQVATVACAPNSLIDLTMGDLETFLKSLNDWSAWNIGCRKMEMMNS